MNGIQAVIFDLDGLMVHTELLCMKAWQQLLAEFGYSLSAEEYRMFIGVDSDKSVNLIRQGMDIPLSNKELLDLRYRYSIALVREGVRPAEGLQDCMESIKDRDLKMGIASNSRSNYVHAVLETIGLNGDFSCVVAADQVDKGKPAPDVYQAVAKSLGVAPRDCLALEDSPTGLQSALNARMRCVVVPNPELLDASFEGAYALFPSLSALNSALDRVLG
jgi:HAD superfamily hydrolase (TIGR01509 family)